MARPPVGSVGRPGTMRGADLGVVDFADGASLGEIFATETKTIYDATEGR